MQKALTTLGPPTEVATEVNQLSRSLPALYTDLLIKKYPLENPTDGILVFDGEESRLVSVEAFHSLVHNVRAEWIEV